jgi:protein-tyrosine phosphatase
MDIVRLDQDGFLYLSPDIDDWAPLEDLRISAVIDMDGDLDIGVPTIPNHMLYIYFPIFDEELPDLEKLHAVAKMGARLIKSGHKVLSHCGMGFNRSALMAGLIMVYMGSTGPAAVELIRERRPGALFNENFASYLMSIEQVPRDVQ